MRDWHILREDNRKGCGTRYDLGAFWRGEWYFTHPQEEMSEARYRAAALTYSFENLPTNIHPDDEIVGDASFLLDELPQNIDKTRYCQAMEAHKAHPVRNFALGGNHTLPHFPTILTAGLGGVEQKIRTEIDCHDLAEEKDYLQALLQTLHGLITYIRRYAEAANRQGRTDLAQRLKHIAICPPANLAEAIQLVWLIFIANRAHAGYANALGRVDQYLWRFYDGDRENALQLFCHWWSKIEGLHLGDGANQSNVVNIAVGGQKPDCSEAANELTSIILEATRLVRSPCTNISARFTDKSPQWYHQECAETILAGTGFPALFNDEVIIPGLLSLGIPEEDARDYCLVGCVETMLPGLQPGWSDEGINTTLLLDRVYRHYPATYQELWDNLRLEWRQALRQRLEVFENNLRANPPSKVPDLLLSLFTLDCVARGRDIHAGGSRYPRFHGVDLRGFATMVDSLTALKKLVYAEKRLSLDQVITALDADFVGHEYERQILLNQALKYGNDNPYVDTVARDLAEMWYDEVLACRVFDSGSGIDRSVVTSLDGRFLPLIAGNIHNIAAGREVGATPDGRRAYTPLSTTASPYFGNDRQGPTAFFASVSAPDYTRCSGGVVVNMRFDPDFFSGDAGVQRMTLFTREFVRRRIQEMQFNFNNNLELEAAINEPEKYRNLVVRVSGFSAYFVTLPLAVQRDIIRRRAHAAM